MTTNIRPPARHAELVRTARQIPHLAVLEDIRDDAVQHGDELAARVYAAEIDQRTLATKSADALLGLLEVENVIAMSHDTSTHVAFIAHVMLGTDFAFLAKADGHGAMQFGQASASYLGRLGGVEAVQNRVVELAEKHLCDRHADGRYYRLQRPDEICFGLAGSDAEISIGDIVGHAGVVWEVSIPADSVQLIRKLATILLDLETIPIWSAVHVSAFLRRHGFVNETDVDGPREAFQRTFGGYRRGVEPKT